MREAVWKLLDAFRNFSILEVTQAAVKLTDLFLPDRYDMFDLCGREPYPPKHAAISLNFKRQIKCFQAFSILEFTQVLLDTRLRKIQRLGKHLHDHPRTASLLAQRG